MTEAKINVVVRIRPFAKDEQVDENVIRHHDAAVIVTPPDASDQGSAPNTPQPRTPRAPTTPRAVPTTPSRLAYTPGGKTPKKPQPKQFNFDNVFPPATTQQEVYDYVQPFVQSALSGFNATILAYGQTGAGKTYTMMGDLGQMGVIPRAVSTLFDTMHSDSSTDKLYHVKMSYVELYNDKFRDLLSADNDPALQKSKLPSHVDDKIALKERNKSIVLVGSDTLQTPVTSCAEAMNLINKGNRARAVGATLLNARSSRSHAILIFHIESQIKASLQAITVSKLHLVDLAGSERLELSGSEGERLLEAQHINGSLTALADVLQALSKHPDGPVPYRNSKLTRLLQDSIGGNAKTLMITNIVPMAAAFRETMSSLKWAGRARSITNAARINFDTDGDSKLRQLQIEVAALKDRLHKREQEVSSLQIKAHSDKSEAISDRLRVIARVNQREKTSLDKHLEEVIYSHHGDIAEQQYAYSTLQLKLDEYKTEMHELRVARVLNTDEIAELKAAVAELTAQNSELQDERERFAEENVAMQQNLAVVNESLRTEMMQHAVTKTKLKEAQQASSQTSADDASAYKQAMEKITKLENQHTHDEKRAAKDAKSIMTLEVAATTARERIAELEKQLRKEQIAIEKLKQERYANTTSPVVQTKKPAPKSKTASAAPAIVIDEQEPASDQELIEAVPKRARKAYAKRTVVDQIKSSELTPIDAISPIAATQPPPTSEPALDLDFLNDLEKQLPASQPVTLAKNDSPVARKRGARKLAKPALSPASVKDDTVQKPKSKKRSSDSHENVPADITNAPVEKKQATKAKVVTASTVSTFPLPTLAEVSAPSLAQVLFGKAPAAAVPGKRRLFCATRTVPLSPSSPTTGLFDSFTVPKLKKATGMRA
eukprot:TRINITY_DN12707_c0_g1_i1.p1 TRINITY_DN12707_c0_g1~~TRINITY_DN12707_c0_g1_i1.p1  ORF type:complete len:889 (+),score=219.47 TRINITY_DN12707_c0_g1_i1:46-2712(+)